MKILFIDNFDSFTYNLVDEFRRLGCKVKVYRNNISIKQLDDVLADYKPNLIVLSPGPSHPKDAGICIPLIKKYYKNYPMLGICLGHQCMIEAFGGKVVKAEVPVHGKKSEITHTNSNILSGVPNPFSAGRYHSLYGLKIPSFFKVTALSGKVPMAIENKEYKIYGLQFHPESILTAQGSKIIKNILEGLK
jgi:anthranilate synthase component 2